MNNLTIKVTSQPAKLDYDINLISAQIDAIIEAYRNNPIDIDTAKQEKAEINNMIKAINEREIAIEKELTEQVKQFRADMKEQKAKLTDLSNERKKLVDDAEEQRRSDKLGLVYELNGIPLFVEFYGVPDQWLNKTTTLKKIQEEIDTALVNLDEQIKTIEKYAEKSGIPKVENVLNTYVYPKYVKMLKNIQPTEIMTRIDEDAELLKKKDTPIAEEEQQWQVVLTLKGGGKALERVGEYIQSIGVEIKNKEWTKL